mmetsp:Transcript_36417/g.89762  ORF Transcript_36417/g.89762 Transcript_36417/m.89762 type:complete len:269 (-) Transcript_36417:198-1004(-)
MSCMSSAGSQLPLEDSSSSSSSPSATAAAAACVALSKDRDTLSKDCDTLSKDCDALLYAWSPSAFLTKAPTYAWPRLRISSSSASRRWSRILTICTTPGMSGRRSSGKASTCGWLDGCPPPTMIPPVLLAEAPPEEEAAGGSMPSPPSLALLSLALLSPLPSLPLPPLPLPLPLLPLASSLELANERAPREARAPPRPCSVASAAVGLRTKLNSRFARPSSPEEPPEVYPRMGATKRASFWPGTGTRRGAATAEPRATARAAADRNAI